VDLPLALTTALESGNCVLFIGAGVGRQATLPNGDPSPTAFELAEQLAKKYNIEAGPNPDLAKVAQVVQVRKGRKELIAQIDAALADLEPDEHLRWLFSLTWRAIYTTNYDALIERCYELNPSPTQTPVVIAANSEAATWDPRFEVPVFHLHGSLRSEEGKDAILVTEDDYSTYRERRRMLFEQFKYSYATTPILYIGYSNNDPNWRMVTSELKAEFLPKSPPPAFRLAPSTNSLDREILESQGISTLDGTLADLASAVKTTLGHLRVEPHVLETLKQDIPPDLRTVFAEAPAAVARLLNSWSYVNQADFATQPNTSAFLKGDRPNWALVGQGLNFQRDLEEPLVELMLTFATDPEAKRQSHIILGPAGYGMTTLLMAASAWFAKNRAGSVLFLKPSGEVREADIEFAVRNLPVPLLLVVDNAADHLGRIERMWNRLAETGLTAFLLLGERLNEWRQSRPSFRPVEHALEPLSDNEIWRLLDCLERANALGVLEPLPADIRFSNIQVRHQKELLVAMREATEGRAFDAIVEDEYRGISTEAARNLYALVCGFTRVRAQARDGLLAVVLGIPLSGLYGPIAASVEGIVEFEPFDEARGLYAARARHHVIAQIVWNRCVDNLQRERLMMLAIKALNLSYRIDLKAFESFTRDDSMVDALSSLQSRIRFFEAACRKDPDNPYVRQHYARMLLRSKSLELALGQIDSAIEMKPSAKILYHTRGVILKAMALDSDALDLGRRRLAQSESAFSQALALNPSDEYTYQTLAELYLGWARKTPIEDESIVYVTKAEEAVRVGLSRVRRRDGLYLISADIERYLGNTPQRISALRKALSEAPDSAVACYLLGTVLRRQQEYVEAEKVLYEGVRKFPDDRRITMALAMTLHEAGRNYDECIAILSLAADSGLQDPKFIAVYGGMLTMAGQISEADRVWKRWIGLNLELQERDRIEFEPTENGMPLWLDGRVAKVDSGFSFISAKGLPDFYCRGSKYRGISLRRDQVVRFRPGFSPRGPIVAELSVD
jgi:tetratricopeptide (TPR) repeat protein